MTHRFLFVASLLVLWGSAFLTGCGPKHAPPVAADAISTLVDPARAAASPQITAHPMRFADTTRQAGITWTYANGATGKHYMIESIGSGVALFDFNHDGLLDLFAVQSGPVPGATGAARNFPTRSALYRNNGDGTFTDVIGGSGLDRPMGYAEGVSSADYDNDGWADLYVTAYGGSHLFHNNGDGTFSDVTRKAGVADTRAPGHPGEPPWPLSSAWGDFDNDGKLDLFVCHYARWSLKLNKDCPNTQGKLSYCRPQVYEPSRDVLFHNNGDGTFSDVTNKAGLGKLQGKSMSAAWLDFDDDGWLDLFVTNDTMVNFLLHNNHDGTFTDKAIVAGVAFSENGETSAGMGIGVADYDNDGREDLFVVNFSGQIKSAYRNMGRELFQSVSAQSNLASSNLQFLGFGLEAFDYDLDGHKDLVVGNGHVLEEEDARNNASTYAQSQQLFHNKGDGTFVDDLRSLGDLALPRVTRGLAVGDMDNDGDWDIAMVSQLGPLQLYRNDGGNQNHWITLRLEGVTGNRDAIGAKVIIQTAAGKQTQWVRSGSSYLSESDRRVTFGLGGATQIQSLVIRWPGGKTQKFGALPGDKFYFVREGSAPTEEPRKAKTR